MTGDADAIYMNGDIVTIDDTQPTVEAVAVKDGRIIALGTPATVYQARPKQTPARGADDATQALSYLRRFSSDNCLNGHVHQLFSKTEGDVTFYSGTTTTAYPLPHPGDGPAPKPATLPAGALHDALGIREVS